MLIVIIIVVTTDVKTLDIVDPSNVMLKYKNVQNLLMFYSVR